LDADRHSVAVSNRSEEEEEEKNVLPVQAKRERGARSFCNYKRKRKAATGKVCALTKFINYFFFAGRHLCLLLGEAKPKTEQ